MSGTTGQMLEPDRDQLEIFINAIFRHASTGFVSLRAFYEGEDKVFRLQAVPRTATNFFNYLCDVAQDIARRAAQDPKSVVFCPPLATFRNGTGAGENDLLEGFHAFGRVRREPGSRAGEARAPARPRHGRRALGRYLAKQRRRHDKQHLHWRLRAPARTKEELAKLKRAREIACHLVGADPTTAPVCHPLRWPGSWHRKAAPRPCEIIAEASDFDHEIDLDEALEKLEPLAPPPAPADANGAGGRARTGTSMSATSCAASCCISRSPSWQ